MNLTSSVFILEQVLIQGVLVVGLVIVWILILLRSTLGDDPDGEGETDLDPADALEDLVEVGHQLHLDHEIVRDPGLILVPHDNVEETQLRHEE